MVERPGPHPCFATALMQPPLIMTPPLSSKVLTHITSSRASLHVEYAKIGAVKARNRLPPWHEHRRLLNGREIVIRPIRPEDAEPLRLGFNLLKPEEIRQRFLYAIKELTPETAARLTRPHPDREFALVVAEPMPPGEALIGAVARIAIKEGSREGEFAILVSHYISGMGLGRLLMLRLVRWAKRKRLTRLYGDVLEHNTAMLALMHSLGFHRESSDSPGLVRVTLDITAANNADGDAPPALP